MTPITRHDLTRLARDQHHLLTTAQLYAAGLSPDAVRWAADDGRLHRVHPGVYAVGRPDLTREQRWLAAVLACGDGALLSHRAAARLWDVVQWGGERPEVLLPHASGRRGRPAFDVHRSRTLLPGDATIRFGIPVTSLERTLIDCAGTVERRALKAAVREGERRHGLDLPALHRRVAEPRTNVAHARLFALLTRLVPAPMSDSELEARFLELCERHRIPRPEHQYAIGDHRADFCWPELRLVVETDGRRDHQTWSAIHDDRVKERALRAAGYEIIRFSWAEVMHQPGFVAEEVRRARRARGG
jgi:very-short-patch-repair endonuclease